MTPPRQIRASGRERAAVRRTRARRIVALAGMLTTVAGVVGVRAALTPPPTQALGSPGLAREAGANGPAGRSPSAQHPVAGGGSARRTRVFAGKAYDVGYGVVQVKVKLAGNRISDITPMSLPAGGRSGDISQFAAPQLRREALAAQSANIDSVSGASYTSAGYARSLQSALDQSRR